MIEWAWLACLFLIHLLGYGYLFLGVGALQVAFEKGGPENWIGTITMTGFGISCVFLLPIELFRRQIKGLVALSRTLRSVDPTGEISIPARVYDRITDIEFEQTSVDSHRSLENLSSTRRWSTAAFRQWLQPRSSSSSADAMAPFAVRLSPEFQTTLATLPESQVDLICDFINGLTGVYQEFETTSPVPGTTFQLVMRSHPRRNEVEVISMGASHG
jgi:hypothetical protein